MEKTTFLDNISRNIGPILAVLTFVFAFGFLFAAAFLDTKFEDDNTLIIVINLVFSSIALITGYYFGSSNKKE